MNKSLILLPILALLPFTTNAASSSHLLRGQEMTPAAYKQSVYVYKTDLGKTFLVKEYEPLTSSGSRYIKIVLPDGSERILQDVTEAQERKFQDKENTIAWLPLGDQGTLIDLAKERHIGNGIMFEAKLIKRPVNI
ncbi:hypothetical protein SAMN02745181_3804 [Rubritalea squalenifaciens DSM 18772]|uniref:Uncharacterized protein n=1 Tax=Rubritalea squalenifaciens DSM 18772 TaxID=1123071 RepID=A0A1M6SEV4_9BACT|nr:hypothetical protein [Rubritalea squalenifaciens]SHK43087.1 hypothetical protein SAMN02745181_3804 [Rubritalea squalenifaciens DSM 18772]